MNTLPSSVLNALPVGVAILKRDLSVCAWNAALHEWTGISEDAIVGRPLAECLPRLRDSVALLRIEQVFSVGAPAVFSAQLHGALFTAPGQTGGERKQHVTVTLMQPEAGAEPRALVTVEDVTELSDRIGQFRRTNQQLKGEIAARSAAEGALRESEGRYRAISELSIDFALSLAADDAGILRIEWATDAFERITGYARADLQTAADLRVLAHPDDLATVEHIIQQALLDGQPHEIEHRMITRSGVQRFLWTRTHRDSTGAPRLTMISRDVTELKAARDRAVEFELEQERTRLLASFVQNMSHDLRTPLAEISTGLSLMERMDAADERREMVARLHGQILQLGRLLDEVNQLTQYDSVRSLNLVEMNLNYVLIMLADSLRDVHSGAHRVRIITEFAQNLPLVRGEQGALLRALSAVLDNAMRYAPDHSAVTIRSYATANEAVVEIADQGPGMDEVELARIFRRFHKANTARTADGSGAGLGLAMVKRIMDLHGGTVDVQSARGRGSVFSLRLPAAPARPPANPARGKPNLVDAHLAAHTHLKERRS